MRISLSHLRKVLCMTPRDSGHHEGHDVHEDEKINAHVLVFVFFVVYCPVVFPPRRTVNLPESCL